MNVNNKKIYLSVRYYLNITISYKSIPNGPPQFILYSNFKEKKKDLKYQ